MSFHYLLLCIGLVFSLIYWGVLRTAIWLVPGIFIEGFWTLSSASLLSFFAVAGLVAPYHDNGFDLRSIRKEHWVLIFFTVGVLGASLLYPVPLTAFGFSSLLPLLCIQVFRLFRMPASEFYVFPRWIRWLAPLCWVFIFLFHKFNP